MKGLRYVVAGGLVAFTAFTAPAALAGGDTAPDDPAEVSGIAVPEQDERPLPVAGALLLVPRLAVTAIGVPVREGLVLYERHDVKERVLDIFFDDQRRYGLYPMLTLETAQGVGVGVRAVHRDLFHTGTHARLTADYGGELRRRLDAGITSPALAAGTIKLGVRGGWQRQPDARFHGIGEDSSRSGYITYGQDIGRAELSLSFDPRGPLFSGWGGAWVRRSFFGGAPSERGSVELVYNEVQAGVDTLRVTSPYVDAGAPSTGTAVSVFAGWAQGVEGDPTRYLRYGVDAIRYFDLYLGDRVLVLKGHLEGVAGDRDRIPFTDLPRLGGSALLRGHLPGRFQDRVAVLGSAEYHWPVWAEMQGFLFVDAGRVLGAAADLAPGPLTARAPKLGYGGGLEVVDQGRFRLRAQAAGSDDGLYLQLSFQPAYRVQTPRYRI
jgi:hypothetical protein